MTDLDSLAHTANDVHREYVAVHNAIFEGSLWTSIRRMLPIPGIFVAIPYASHAQTLSQLRHKLRQVETGVDSAVAATADGSSELRFLQELIGYCRALNDTIAQLHAICAGLAEKADATGGPTMGEYKQSIDTYGRSREAYMAVGARLNSAFRSLRGPQQDPLENQAKVAVSAARVLATGAYMPTLQQHALLEQVESETWDFFITVAAVFIAATRLNSVQVSDEHKDRLLEIMAHDLENWDSNGIPAFGDCKSLFEREFDRLTAVGHDARFVAADALGIWIVWNLLGRQPQTRHEISLVRSAGVIVTSAFFDWWAPQ